MKFQIQAIPQDNAEAFAKIVSVVYSNNEPVSPAELTFSDEVESYLATVDGVPAGIFRLLPQKIWIGESGFTNLGVALVGVLPEFRHLGVGKKMLNWAVKSGIERGFAASGLYPFSESFYRQFEYAAFLNGLKFRCPIASFPTIKSLPEGITYCSISPTDPNMMAKVKACYEEFAKNRTGLVSRTDFYWERKFGAKSTHVCYGIMHGEDMIGYVLAPIQVDFHKTSVVEEFIWLSHAGYEAGLKMIRNLAVNKSHIEWIEGGDSDFISRYLTTIAQFEIGRKTESCPTIMYRALNLKTVFQSLGGDWKSRGVPALEFGIRVTDSVHQDSTLRVKWDGGAMKVEEGAIPDFSLSVLDFTRCLFGSASFSLLVREGQITQNNASAPGSIMDVAFPRRSPFCLDFY